MTIQELKRWLDRWEDEREVAVFINGNFYPVAPFGNATDTDAVCLGLKLFPLEKKSKPRAQGRAA